MGRGWAGVIPELPEMSRLSNVEVWLGPEVDRGDAGLAGEMCASVP
jgi:hypothetical protein